MKLKKGHRIFLGLLLGALVLLFLKEYKILPGVMLVIGLVSLFSPFIAEQIDRIVTKLLRMLGTGISAVLLFITYFLVLTPIALIAKLFGRTDSLGLKQPTKTNFRNVDKKYDTQGFEKMW